MEVYVGKAMAKTLPCAEFYAHGMSTATPLPKSRGLLHTSFCQGAQYMYMDVSTRSSQLHAKASCCLL